MVPSLMLHSKCVSMCDRTGSHWQYPELDNENPLGQGCKGTLRMSAFPSITLSGYVNGIFNRNLYQCYLL